MTEQETWTRDIANELSSIGEALAEGDLDAEAARDRLWALSARPPAGATHEENRDETT